MDANKDDNGNDLNRQLLVAIRDQKEQNVLQLLQQGADPNLRTSNIIDGETAYLHSAVRMKNCNIVRTLLSHGANVNIEDQDGDTPYFSAVYEEIPVELRTLLTTYGADKNHRNKCGITPLCKMLEDCLYWGFKFCEDTLMDLLESCDDYHIYTTNGSSLIHLVSTVHSCSDNNTINQHTCVVYLKSLIRNGVSVNSLDPFERTPLHSAASVCCHEGIQFLLDQGADVKAKDIKGQTALHQIGKKPIQTGFEKSLNLLIQYGCSINEVDVFGRTVVHYTANSENTNKAAMEILCKYGAVLNVKDKAMLTPLHFSVLPTVIVPYSEAEDEYPQKSDVVDVISYLVKNGVGVDDVDLSERTPLHLAVRERDTNVIKCLLRLGADVNKRTKTGETVLHRATIDVDSFDAVMDTSNKSTVDINAQDIFGCTPLHWAAWYLESAVIDKLKIAGSRFDVKDKNGKTAADIAYDLKHTNVYDALGILYDRQFYPLPHEEPISPRLKLTSNLESDPNLGEMLSLFTSSQNPENVAYTDYYDSRSASPTSDENIEDIEDDKDDIDEEKCNGRDFLYPDCPLLRTIYIEMKSINLLPWKTHLQEHKAALQTFVGVLLNAAPPNMALFQETTENQEVAEAVRQLLMNVSKQINSRYPLFQCEISLAGSWNEGTKTTCPDEFDYNCRLLNFTQPFKIEESSTVDGEFVRFRLKNDMIKSEFSRFVDKNGYLDGRKVICDFYTIFNDILLCSEIHHHNSLYITKYLKIDKGSISNLTFRWVGQLYKDMLIEVDIVPSILPENFSPRSIYLGSRLVRNVPNYHKIELDVVLKTPNERFVRDWNTYFRISVAKLEATLIKSLPNSVRKGFSLVKALRDTLYMPQVYDNKQDCLIRTMMSTYILKTCFFHVLEAAVSSSDKSLELPADDTSKKVTADWSKRILEYLGKSMENRSLSGFIVSGVNLFLHESTNVCNDMYIREAEADCLTELVMVGVEEWMS